MKTLITAAAVASALVFSMATAQAATYNFGGSNGSATSYTVGAAGGPDVTASIARRSGGNVVASDGATLVRRANGIGANYSYDGDPTDVDGSGRDEVVVLNFAAAVKLISATFAGFDSNDSFTLWFDDDGNGNLNGDRVGSASNSPYLFTHTYIGTLFGLGAEGYNDNWRLASIEANAISAVPVPAALPLFGAALLGMGFLARRRKQKAAMQA